MHALPWLVADIGGTNMRLGRIVQPDGPVVDVTRIDTPRSGDLAPVLRSYLDRFFVDRPRSARLALAGPITTGKVQLTNTGAHLDTKSVARQLGIDQIVVVNDLEAVAAALPHLAASQVRVLGSVDSVDPTGTRLVLGCGTGCGVGATFWSGNRWQVVASEGGHLPFPAQSSRDRRWREHVARALPPEANGRVTYDRVLCGSGMVALAQTVAIETGAAAPITSEDVVRAAIDCTDTVAVESAQHFASTVASFAGDLAQVFLPRGGVYLIGSLLEGIERFLTTPESLSAYAGKWPNEPLVSAFPLRLIADPLAPLLGLGKILAHTQQ